ncbi:MAG: histidine kinase dimerization/phospho-acceptor domain-containing protein, partial [Myxococcota bacterium]
MDSSTTPFFRDEELREEDVLGLELQAWGLFTLIDLADQFVGAERVDEAIRPWGIDLRKLVKKRAWVTFDFAERVMDKLVQITGPELIARAGAASVSPRYLGPIYPLVRTFGNTASTFERILGSSPRYNKARDISLVWESEQRGRVRVALKPEIGPPKTRYFCEFAGAQLEAIPVLFGLPHARVIQTRCACDGNDACEFDIEWFPGKKRMPLWPVPIAFGTAGVALANALGGGVPIAAALGTACAVASLASAVVFRQQQELSSRLEDIDEHRSALSRSVRENELRFAEIVEAKSEVEDRVEERTRELGVATKQLQQTLDELQAMDQAKSDFFANVSHELRTPLTLIVSPLESLQRGSLSNDGRRIALETIENNARRLLRLINQLLDLAKVDARQATVSLSAVDLSQFVRD